MTPENFTHVNRGVWLRSDHDLVGRILAKKLDARTDRARMDCGFRVVGR